MWSFIGIFLLVLVGLVLLSHPAVSRLLSAMTMLSVLFVVTFWASLVIWLLIPGPG